VFSVFCHSRLLASLSNRTDLFSSLELEHWISIDRIMEVHLCVYTLDPAAWNRDDLAVADSSNRVGRAFGAKLLAAREKAELTQEQLSHLSSVNAAQISQLELGNYTPRLDTILKLAGGLGIEPCELIGDVRFKPPVIGPDKGGWVDP
jgi:DNA-binding XRE family transcriptional regulator